MALERQALAKNVAVFVADDTTKVAGQISNCPVALRLKYKGTGTVTSVTVTTATNIVMVTSDGGTDTYAFATYDTVAKLANAINADGIFEAKILDTMASFATASQFTDGAITSAVALDGTRVWDVTVDTSAALYMAWCLTPNREFNYSATSHRVHLQEIAYLVDAGTAKSVYVYERNPATSQSVLVYKAPAVDNTLTTISWASGNGKISSNFGNELLVVIDATTTLADAGYIRIAGIVE